MVHFPKQKIFVIKSESFPFLFISFSTSMSVSAGEYVYTLCIKRLKDNKCYILKYMTSFGICFIDVFFFCCNFCILIFILRGRFLFVWFLCLCVYFSFYLKENLYCGFLNMVLFIKKNKSSYMKIFF